MSATAYRNTETLQYVDTIAAVLTIAYDKIFNTLFSYSRGIYQSLTVGNVNTHWYWQINYYPSLLISPSVKKIMIGYEMFGSS